MQTLKALLLLLLVAVLAVVTGACNNSNTGGGNANNTAGTVTTSATSDNKIGVAECDDFLAKYESCMNDKVPEAARGTFKSGADSLRQKWKQQAATTQGRISLAITCSAARESAKQATMQYGCEL